MARVQVTTTMDHKLKNKIQEKTNYSLSEVMERGCEEVLDDLDLSEVETDIYSFNWRSFTRKQRKFAEWVMKEASDATSQSDLVQDAVDKKGLYSKKDFAKNALDQAVNSDLPIIRKRGKVQVDKVQCQCGLMKVSTLFKTGKDGQTGFGVKGECFQCGHVFEGLQK